MMFEIGKWQQVSLQQIEHMLIYKNCQLLISPTLQEVLLRTFLVNYVHVS